MNVNLFRRRPAPHPTPGPAVPPSPPAQVTPTPTETAAGECLAAALVHGYVGAPELLCLLVSAGVRLPFVTSFPTPFGAIIEVAA